jgi:2-polyprenyl-3-methyl-5-hydroxy-6-metoxy-1,4-benzoquinol methylase
MSTTQTEMESLKTRLKSMWMAGDFAQIALIIQAAADEFIASLGIKPGDKVLDVACGSGNLAIPAARAGATGDGVDIAPNLLEQARERAASEGLTIQLMKADAESLPYPDGAFDLVGDDVWSNVRAPARACFVRTETCLQNLVGGSQWLIGRQPVLSDKCSR